MRVLSDMQRLSLSFDKRVLGDLGLSMPRLTQKYLDAVFTLSELQATSPYFYHVIAARDGREVLYCQLREVGYVWDKSERAWVSLDV